MPKIPVYDNFQTQVSSPSAGQFQVPSGPAAGAIAADQISQQGQALTRSGDTVGRIALDVADQVNQVRVNDAINQARQAAQDLAYNKDTGYVNLRGNDALTRPDGKSLTEEYGSKLQDTISNIAGTLGNPAQQRAFQMQSADIETQFHGQVQSHMLQQFQSYHDDVDDATAKLASDNARLHWGDPTYANGYKDPVTGDWVPGAIDQVKAAVMSRMQRAGLTGAPADAALLTGVSAVHAGVIQAALENGNPSYAANYMEQARAKGEMSADDILKLQGHLNQQVWAGLANTAVQTATVKAVQVLAPTSFDKMVQITAQSESGGHETNPNGTTVTSPKGALGVMQVMPATSKDPGFGVKPAQDDSPGERARVGRDFLQAMMQRYGDPAKAWAAYNAGPGTLDKALKDSAAGRSGGVDWLSYMPKETQDYVAKNTAALQGTGPVAARPTELDFVNNVLAQLPAGTPPMAVKMAHEQAQAQFAVINKSINEKGQQALSAVQNWLWQNKDNGGGVATVPPSLMGPLMQYAPGDARNLEAFSKTIQRGDVVTNLGRYNDITSNMETYAKMGEGSWNMLQTELAPSDFKHLSKQRADYINGGTDASVGGINSARVTRSLNEALAALKIPTQEGSPLGKIDPERLGGIRAFVDRSIFDQQKAIGKKLTPEQIDDHIHQLFAIDVNFKNTLWYGGTGADTSQKLMAMQIGDLPSGAAEGIRKSLVAMGNKAPTDTDVLNLYRKLHASK